MARDFAKQHKAGQRAKGPARKKSQRASASSRGSSQAPAGSGWRWYAAGVLTGCFLSFLLYLGTLPSTGNNGAALEQPEAATAAEHPEPRFDFYTLLPRQTIEVEVEPADVTRSSAGSTVDLYLLQAGSFRQRDDADRRRAELLLLGLEPRVEETSGDNGRWFRVYLGPFDSRAKMSKARSLTAAQDIDTLLLKRGAP